MANHDETIETYNKVAKNFSESHFDHFWIEEFDFYRQLIPGKKVIDIGCGAGRDASVFSEYGFDYTGIDASGGMLEVACQRVPEAKFILMDFYKLDFPDESFDGFWAAASLLHIPKGKVAGVLQSLYKLIKKGGIGFISVKAKKQLDEGMIEENKVGGIKRFFAFYDLEEFKNLLINAGFKIERTMIHDEDNKDKTKWLCYFVRK